MTDQVVTATVKLDDQASANADAAADALNKLADAADRVETSTGKAGPSAATLARRYSDSAKAAADLDKAQRALANGTATMAAAVARGFDTGTAADVIATLTARVEKARAAMDALKDGAAAAEGVAAVGAAAKDTEAALKGATHASTGLYRELLVMAHETITGRFNRLPGSAMVLAERSGNLEGIVSGTVAALTSTAGIISLAAAAGAAALAAMGVAAEDARLRIEGLQNQLRGSRSDFATLAPVVDQSAHTFAAANGPSFKDSFSAAHELAAVPTFSGQSADLQAELGLAQNLALVWNTTLPDAAKKLAASLGEPEQAAEKLAAEGFPGMTAAAVENIRTLTEQGDVLGAQRALLDAYGRAATGATQNMTPLERALHDLGVAFAGPEEGAGGFIRAIGDGVTGALAGLINGVTGAVTALNSLWGWLDAHHLTSSGAANTSIPGIGGSLLNFATGGAFGQAYDAITGAGAHGAPVAGPFAGFTPPNSAGYAQQQAAANNSLLLQADKLSQGSPAARTATLQNENTALEKARGLVQQGSLAYQEYTQQITKNNDEITKLAEGTDHQADSLNKAIEKTSDAIGENISLAAAYGQGADAVAKATAAMKAQQEVDSVFGDKADQQADAVSKLAGMYEDLARAEGDVKLAQDTASGADRLQYIQAETDSLGENSKARSVMLAELQAEQEARRATGGIITDQGQAYIQEAGDIAQATAALQAQQQSLQELQGLATSVFDDIGNAITQAFVGGQGHAVSFGNVVRGIAADLVTRFSKVALFDPITSGLLGTGGSGALAGAGGTGGGVGSLFSGASNALGLPGVSGYLDNLLMGDSASGSLLSDLGSTLDLTGSSGLLNTVLWGGNATASAVEGAALDGTLGSGAMAGASVGTTLGGAFSGVGAGFGVGTMLNTALGGNQTSGMVGAGVGSIAGAAIGSIIPGVGTILGGIIGGAAGGGLGGMLGPGEAHHGWGVNVTSDGSGGLALGSSGFDKYTGSMSQQEQAILDGITQAINSLNMTLAGQGLTATLPAGGITLGGNNAGPITPQNITDPQAFSQLRFNAPYDPQIESVLPYGSFSGTQQLDQFVQWYQGTFEKLSDVGDTAGSLNTSLQALDEQYAAAIATAKQYNLSQGSIAALAAGLTTASDQLATNTNESFGSQIDSYQERAMAAANPNDPVAKANAAWLASVDEETQARTQFSQSLIDTYGQSFAASANYAQAMKQLADAYSLEQQNILNAPTEAAAGTASGLVSGLNGYVNSLLTGGSNPAGYVDQLTAASGQWNTISAGALAGNVTDISELQGAASSYLGASQNIYGTGTGYVQAFNQVIDVLKQVASTPQNTLTADVLKQTSEQQTQVLNDSLKQLIDSVNSLTGEFKQGGATPPRLNPGYALPGQVGVA